MSLMQIPRKIEYALRAMIHLADHPEGVARGTEIARDEQIPKYYLEKVIRDLMHRGLVRARRGPGGGYQLARPADEVTFKDVIEAVEGPITLNVCVDGSSSCAPAADLPDVPRVGGRPARSARDFLANHAQRNRRLASRADTPGESAARDGRRRQGSCGRQGLNARGRRPSPIPSRSPLPAPIPSN